MREEDEKKKEYTKSVLRREKRAYERRIRSHINGEHGEELQVERERVSDG